MSTGTSVDNAMTIERLKGFFDACNAHDVDEIVAYFTEDGTYFSSVGPTDDGTPFRGIDEVRRGFTAFLQTYPDGRYSDIHVSVDGTRGVAEWTFNWRTSSGEGMKYRGVDLLEFRGNRIAAKDAFRKERAEAIGSQD